MTENSANVCDALLDLVAFVQFKKREKHPWRSVNFSKVAGISTTFKERKNFAIWGFPNLNTTLIFQWLIADLKEICKMHELPQSGYFLMRTFDDLSVVRPYGNMQKKIY